MTWVIAYFVIALVCMPILGRLCANEYRETPRTDTQVAPATFAVAWGLFWPIMLAGIAFFHIGEFFSNHSSGLRRVIRRILTGTNDIFEPRGSRY